MATLVLNGREVAKIVTCRVLCDKNCHSGAGEPRTDAGNAVSARGTAFASLPGMTSDLDAALDPEGRYDWEVL